MERKESRRPASCTVDLHRTDGASTQLSFVHSYQRRCRHEQKQCKSAIALDKEITESWKLACPLFSATFGFWSLAIRGDSPLTTEPRSVLPTGTSSGAPSAEIWRKRTSLHLVLKLKVTLSTHIYTHTHTHTRTHTQTVQWRGYSLRSFTRRSTSIAG